MGPGWPLLLLLQQAPVPTPEVPTFTTKVHASVLLVHGRMGGALIHQGSGVVIAPNLVATNAHVVAGAQGITVKRGQVAWPVSEVRVDPSQDLCLLTVPGLQVPPVELAPEPTEVGQPVWAVGFPGGQGPVVSKGHLRGLWHHQDSQLIQSDALTLPGNSGGGLFDREGRLLGLTTLTFTPSARLNFSVPVAWIQALALQPPGVVGPQVRWGLESHAGELLEALATDPRNWPAWQAAARQWVQDLPRDEKAWLALGLALDRSARSSSALGQGASAALLQEGVAAYRRSLSLRKIAKTFNNLGVALDLLNQFDEAEAAFGEALQLEPTYALAWLNLGSARFNAGRFAKAAEALQKGLALQPDEGDAWARLGYCQRRLGQQEPSLASLKIALRYRPMAAELWLDLGLALVEQRRLEEAGEVHTRLSALDPELAARLLVALKRAPQRRTVVGEERPHR